MATSSFKSTTRRSSLAPSDAVSSTRIGRSRSLSRYSGRFPPPPESDDFTTPKGKFVNKTRRSGFGEIISLDHLADEFFGVKGFGFEDYDDDGSLRSGSDRTGSNWTGRSSERFLMETEASRRRGRSVSKKGGFGGNGDGSRGFRRSVSVARERSGDLEDTKKLLNTELIHHARIIGQRDDVYGKDCSSRQRRSTSVARYRYSDLESHSSSLTEDEVRDVCSLKSGCEKTIQTVYTQEKAVHPTGDGEESGLYEAMRNEVRHAVHEIRTELEKSEKRKQDLLAELAAEEQHGQQLTNIVRELLPASKQAAFIARPRSCRKSNDRTRMSKCLTEEAERYFEDFLSNVEDTDLSSFDGERSDTSSILGGSAKLTEPIAIHNAISEVHPIRAKASLPAEIDGVLLPWLEWETSNDVSPSPCKSKVGVTWTAVQAQETNAARDSNSHLSSLGSWSPKGNESSPEVSSEAIQNTFKVGSLMMQSCCFSAAISSFDMDEYLALQRDEDCLYEISKHRQRIESGSLIMCPRTLI